MNSLSLVITAIILAVAVSSTVAQTWYTPCVAKGTPFKCPGYLRTEKLPISSPMCQGLGDEYACHDDSQDTDGGWRPGQVTTPCSYRGRTRFCPSGFRRSIDKSSYCKDNIGPNMIRMICSA